MKSNKRNLVKVRQSEEDIVLV